MKRPYTQPQKPKKKHPTQPSPWDGLRSVPRSSKARGVLKAVEPEAVAFSRRLTKPGEHGQTKKNSNNNNNDKNKDNKKKKNKKKNNKKEENKDLFCCSVLDVC